jgi:hypothetical protein
MAHFAILKTGNIVEQVIVVSNDIATTEQEGINYLKNLYKNPNLPIVQTSYNSNIRKNFAGIGYQYDQTRDAFIAPKPFNSWILNESTCNWEAPVVMPSDIALPPNYIGKKYTWNESTLTWNLVE